MRQEGRVTGVRLSTEPGAAPQSLPARLVVAADGRRSRIARELGFLREAAWPRRFAVRGYWSGVEGVTGFGEMHVGGGGYCGLAPLGVTRANIAFVLDQQAMTPAGGDLETFYRQRLRRWPRLYERLRRARLEAPPSAIGPLALESSRAWAAGVLLVGDAAGFFDPFTGEGIAAALRGAEHAADVAHAHLRRGSDLAEYGRRHEALVREKFRFNRIVQRLVAREGLANVAASVLRRLPSVANALVDTAGDCLREAGPAPNAPSCRMASPELRPRERP
jgi:flavin-dependent dehydrogenase